MTRDDLYLGVEIGGTKLQLGLGRGDGRLAALWRGTVNPGGAAEGIRQQIIDAVPELLARAGVGQSQIRGVGVGFGGPIDDGTRTVITSHQVHGWDDFPLVDWLSDRLGWPVALGNDADVAGLAEATVGAGRGVSPVFYVTVGSGVGGGLIVDGQSFRGCGRGAAEIGHLRVDGDRPGERVPLEDRVSGWAIQKAAAALSRPGDAMHRAAAGGPITGAVVAEAAERGDPVAQRVLFMAVDALAEGLCHVITLLCPRRIVIGGGVSLMGEGVFFGPLRRMVAERVFRPFAGLTDIVPAALGEEVVVHGAIALARQP